jgi:hypothetical protein
VLFIATRVMADVSTAEGLLKDVLICYPLLPRQYSENHVGPVDMGQSIQGAQFSDKRYWTHDRGQRGIQLHAGREGALSAVFPHHTWDFLPLLQYRLLHSARTRPF